MKKIFYFLPILCLITSNVGCFNNSKKQEKFDPETKIIFENCNRDNLTLDENSSHEAQETSYNLSIKLNYEHIEPRDYDTEEEKRIEYQRLKNYYSSNNNRIVKNMDFSAFDDVYVSTYSPYVSIDTSYESIANENYSNLLNIASYAEVEQVTVNQSNMMSPHLTTSEHALGASDYINETGFTGDGITIGILEIGIPDKNHANLVDADITIRDVWNAIETKTTHTTAIASILVGPDGFVPEAKLVCAQLFGDPAAEIDWMLDRDALMINCSFGDSNPTGVYSSTSAYFDFIAYTYHTLFVCAAGNAEDDNEYVCNPGLGYNVLTMGACQYLCTNPNWGEIMCSSSNVVTGPRKPNMVAPGIAIYISPFGIGSGTSISTAITTGCIALLMQTEARYRMDPLLAISTLAVTGIDKLTRDFGSGYDNEGGAGVINIGTALNVERYVYKFLEGDTESTTSVYLTEGTTARISAFWVNKNTTGNVSGLVKSHYVLTLETRTGDIIEQADYNDDNKAFIELVVPSTGKYRIKVTKKNSTDPEASASYVAFWASNFI